MGFAFVKVPGIHGRPVILNIAAIATILPYRDAYTGDINPDWCEVSMLGSGEIVAVAISFEQMERNIIELARALYEQQRQK